MGKWLDNIAALAEASKLLGQEVGKVWLSKPVAGGTTFIEVPPFYFQIASCESSLGISC